MINGSGFSVEPDAVRRHGAQLGELGAQVGRVHDAWAGAAAVDAALGPVGAESGFVAAYHQRLEQQSRAMQGLD